MQPRCVQTADRSCNAPEGSRYTATFLSPRRTTAPDPGGISPASATSAEETYEAKCAATSRFSRANAPAARREIREGS